MRDQLLDHRQGFLGNRRTKVSEIVVQDILYDRMIGNLRPLFIGDQLIKRIPILRPLFVLALTGLQVHFFQFGGRQPTVGFAQLIPRVKIRVTKIVVELLHGIQQQRLDSAIGFAFVHQVPERFQFGKVKHRLYGFGAQHVDLLLVHQVPDRRQPQLQTERFGDSAEETVQRADLQPMQVLQ